MQRPAWALVAASGATTLAARITARTNLIIVFGPSVAGMIALGWIAADAARK
jgi:hypothetical protein